MDIEASAELDFENRPLTSILVGPVSTSQATWASAARGVKPAIPAWIQGREQLPLSEINGFTLINMTGESVTLELADCGGFDPEREEKGDVLVWRTCEPA